MTPIDNISPVIETYGNFVKAWEGYSEHKYNRRYIINFFNDLNSNINRLLDSYITDMWKPRDYRRVRILDKKVRIISKAFVDDHVIENAMIVPIEQSIYDYVSDRCPAIKPKKGTHAYLRLLRNDLYNNTQQDMYYYIQMDAHHYFPTMDHEILKDKIRIKIKDERLLKGIDRVIDITPVGIPLGIKLAQLLGIMYLADFDRLVMRCFDLFKDKEKYLYWQKRFVNEKIATCRCETDAAVINKGIKYLNNLFDIYVEEGIKHYTRFVDNIIIIHRDKTFLRLMRELAILHLTRDYHITLNRDYNVRPVWTGIRAAGYVIYHDHVMINKLNKSNLCRQIASCRKRDMTQEQTRLKLSSLIGFCAQSKNIKNLLIKNNMEKTLGKIIKSRHSNTPWPDMNYHQKKLFSEIVYDKSLTTEDRDMFKIYLVAYKIQDSIIENEKVKVQIPDADGNRKVIEKQSPKKTLVLRYKKIIDSYFYDGETHYKFAKVKNKDGSPTQDDAEFYSFTGSEILIDEAEKEFSSEDLPCATVIEAFTNKRGNKFYKFT